MLMEQKIVFPSHFYTDAWANGFHYPQDMRIPLLNFLNNLEGLVYSLTMDMIIFLNGTFTTTDHNGNQVEDEWEYLVLSWTIK